MNNKKLKKKRNKILVNDKIHIMRNVSYAQIYYFYFEIILTV